MTMRQAASMGVPSSKNFRSDETLPNLVRFPSLERMRQEIERLRVERVKMRAERRRQRAQQKVKEAEQ